jgi:hypothetical protein
MEPGGPLTGEAQAIEDAAFAHIAGAPRAQHLLPPGTPATPYPLIRKSPGGPGGPVEPLYSVTFETRVLSDLLSDYRMNDLHIQAHVHGLSSRSVLDLDDSPTVPSPVEVDQAGMINSAWVLPATRVAICDSCRCSIWFRSPMKKVMLARIGSLALKTSPSRVRSGL